MPESDPKSLDRANSEFLVVDGNACKLDLLRIDTFIDGKSSSGVFDPDVMKVKHFKTLEDGSLAKSRKAEDHCSCDFVYEPKWREEGTPNI